MLLLQKNCLWLLLACLWLMPVTVFGATPFSSMIKGKAVEPEPSWSLDIKGGTFAPAIPDWEQFYGDDKMGRFAASLAYKVSRYIEVGMEGGLSRDHGKGYLPLNAIVGGDVTYELYPLNVYINLVGAFYENQLLVPYVGGGWTRAYYKMAISNQEDIKGSVDGTHVKGGVRVLLDGMAKGDARNLQAKYGIDNTYLFLEFQTITAKADVTPEVDIGGDSYLLGILFEY
jgi:hypothetical protein